METIILLSLRCFAIVILLLSQSLVAQELGPKSLDYDIVVYGGTSGGIVAAVQAAKMQKSVVLIEPSKHLGGLTSGGLGATDIGNKGAIGGLSRSFYRRIGEFYSTPEAWKWENGDGHRRRRRQAGELEMWTFEPHVAESVYRAMIAEAKVLVITGRLDLKAGVVKAGERISRIRLESSGRNVETAVAPTTSNNCANFVGKNDDNDPLHLNAAGFHWYCIDDKVTKWVQPLKQEVLARSEPFLLNLCYVGFDSSLAFQQVDPQEYSEYTLATLNHLKQSFNLIPDIWELRLEPDRRFQVTGPQLGRMLAAVGPKVRAAGYPQLYFAVPSMADPNRVTSFLSSILAAPGTASFIKEVTYHRYSLPQASTLASIATAAKASGYRVAMLEHIGADAMELYEDLTLGNVSSWQRYALAGPYGGPNGGSQLYFVDTANASYRLRTSTWELRQYFKYVRPGAVRIGATSTQSMVHPVAFRDLRGRIVTVFNADQAATVTVGGLPAGRYEVSYTTATKLGFVVGTQTIAAGAVLTTSIPAKGTLTVAPL